MSASRKDGRRGGGHDFLASRPGRCCLTGTYPHCEGNRKWRVTRRRRDRRIAKLALRGEAA